MGELKERDLAREHLDKAFRLHMEGNLDDAIKFYVLSLECMPTAEAHTYYGWALGQKGELDRAIEECKKAIELDPDFGNPYNDIGSYLIQLGREDEAVQWLESAIKAPRYVPRHFPYFNLGRVYEKKGDWFKALKYFNEAVKIQPEYTNAKTGIIRLTSLLN